MGSKIDRVEYYLPKQTLSNNDLKEIFPDFDENKMKKIGISSRHIASSSQTAVDLAYHAAEKLLKNSDKNSIDFILFCTQSPDYFLPTSACILQDRLGLRKDIGALDFNQGCSGYVYGLSMAKGLIEGGIASNILLLTGETYSKLINEKDKGNRSIFGDAGSATLITKSNKNGIFNFELGSDGSGFENLIVRNGGAKNEKEINAEIKEYGSNNKYTDNELYMNGPEIFNFTIESIPSLIEKTLDENNLNKDEIDYFIFHQANKFMLDYLRKKIGVPKDKFYNDLDDVGNTVSNTIPIALSNSINKNTIFKGSKVLLCGFGVGYSWGATVIEI